MKKLTSQNKKHLLSSSQKSLRNRIKRESKVYIAAPQTNQPKTGFQYGERYKVPLSFTKIIAPENFNLQAEHADKVIKFISEIKRCGQRGENVNIKLENSINIGEGAIAMLLSVLDELHRKNILISGVKPKSVSDRDILEKSGFFKFLSGHVDKKNLKTKNTILRTGGTSQTHVDLSDEIKKANSTVWGTSGRNPPLRGSVFEMMRNSHDHAFKNEESVIWHFAISHDDEKKEVKFSFVDNGKGIIKTFTEGFLSKFLNLFTDNRDLLETAFKDGINSRTGLSWRGKGLPTIYENYQDKYFRNLVVITNDVYLDFDRKIQKKLSVPFSGTYYFWSLDVTCTKACY